MRFSALPDVARNKLVEAGCPIELQCEVSEPTAQVYWHKDGGQLLPAREYEIQRDEKLRALVIKSAEVRHSGLYSCEAENDHIEFKVDVAGDLSILSFVRITNVQLMLAYYTHMGYIFYFFAKITCTNGYDTFPNRKCNIELGFCL